MADRLIEGRGVSVVIASSPAEVGLVEAIVAGCVRKERVVVLGRMNDGRGISIGGLKEVVRRAEVVVCNDTGPRHFAVALKRPVVTLFGPTDPRWAEVFHEGERKVGVPVACGPCQLKGCPIDHRCMKGLVPDRVEESVKEVWSV